MTAEAIALNYDAAARCAILIFPNGRTLTVRDVSEEKAREFHAKHALEFQRRDCCLTTVDGAFTRENAGG